MDTMCCVYSITEVNFMLRSCRKCTDEGGGEQHCIYYLSIYYVFRVRLQQLTYGQLSANQTNKIWRKNIHPFLRNRGFLC